jgi:hypothetical protein
MKKVPPIPPLVFEWMQMGQFYLWGMLVGPSKPTFIMVTHVGLPPGATPKFHIPHRVVPHFKVLVERKNNDVYKLTLRRP